MSEDNWIRFEDEKPDPNEYVIVQRVLEDKVEGAHYRSSACRGHKCLFSLDPTNRYIEDVVFWQRFPEPRLLGYRGDCLCVNCIHYVLVEINGSAITSCCRHLRDPVYGGVMSCKQARAIDGLCGPDGLCYKPKENQGD